MLSPAHMLLSVLAIAALAVVTEGIYCKLFPCFYLQPPYPASHQQTFQSRPSEQGYVYQYPSYHQKPISPIFIFVAKIPDQASSGPGYAVDKNSQGDSGLDKPVSASSGAIQVLNPSTSSFPDKNPTGSSTLASGVQPSAGKPSAPTSIPYFTSVPTTPVSIVDTPKPIDLTNSTVNAVPSVTSNVSGNSEPAESSGKFLDSEHSSGKTGVFSTNTNGHRTLAWFQRWLQPESTSSQPKLCQTNDPVGDFADETHKQCLDACEDAYNVKLERIGLSRIGTMFLGGSCHSQLHGRRDVCVCNVRLGLRYETFRLIGEE